MSRFDEVAADWDKNRMHVDRSLAIAEKLKPFLGDKRLGKGMEFGAGTGLLTFLLTDHFEQMVMLDNSSEMVNVANSKIPAMDQGKIKAIWFDLEKASYPDSDFNMIFTQMVLHHIGDIPNILARFFDLLIPGGMLVVADLYPEDGSFHGPGFDGHLGFDTHQLTSQMEQAGFKVCHLENCFQIHRETADGKEKIFPVFLMVAEKPV